MSASSICSTCLAFRARVSAANSSGYRHIVSMEEGFAGRGGLDAMLYDFLSSHELDAKMLNIGVEGKYRYELGTRAELHELVGIGPDVVTQRILEFLGVAEEQANSVA